MTAELALENERLRRENEAFSAETAGLRQRVDIEARRAARALASHQQHALSTEIIRQKSEELDRLTCELEVARRSEAARAHALELSNGLLRQRELENEALIGKLRDTVAQLSTPILRVRRDALVLPIVGTLDEQRAAAITIRTLEVVQTLRVRHVILDLTGVETVDLRTVDYILRLAHATRLLGARCILCGVRPAVAQVMVEIEAGLSGIRSHQDLSQALAAIDR